LSEISDSRVDIVDSKTKEEGNQEEGDKTETKNIERNKEAKSRFYE